MITAHIGVVLVLTLVGSMVLLFFYHIIFYFFVEERILHFGFELPFIDWHTNFGYTLNFIYSESILFLFVVAAFASIFCSTLFIIKSFGQFELNKMLLDELDAFILANDNWWSRKRRQMDCKSLIFYHFIVVFWWSMMSSKLCFLVKLAASSRKVQ